jgi:hypothetical protein
MVGLKAGFERGDAHARGNGFDDASERAGILRDFLSARRGVGVFTHLERFEFAARA